MIDIVYISPKYPFGVSESRAKVIANYLNQLAIKYNYSVHLICITNDTIDHSTIPQWLSSFTHYFQPTFLRQIYNVILKSIILRQAPIQCYLYWSKKLNKIIDTKIEDINPKIVICELIRMGLYQPRYGNKIGMDIADLFSRRYKQQLLNLDKIDNITGQYQNMPKFIHSLINFHCIKKYLLKTEMILTQKFENVLPEKYDFITLVSPVEQKILSQLTKKKNIFWVPNGTDSIQDFNQYQVPHKENKNIFFLGILNVPHNIEAIMYFISDIFPHIQNKITNVHLNVLGKNPPIELINIGHNHKNITVFGYQKNLYNIIKDSSIMVAPLLSGSGVKTKIFEAMKFSIPIVATSIAAEGIIVGTKSPIIVKDDPYEFAISCIELLSDSLLRGKIGDYGPSIIKEYYLWDAVGKRLNNVLRKFI